MDIKFKLIDDHYRFSISVMTLFISLIKDFPYYSHLSMFFFSILYPYVTPAFPFSSSSKSKV